MVRSMETRTGYVLDEKNYELKKSMNQVRQKETEKLEFMKGKGSNERGIEWVSKKLIVKVEIIIKGAKTG